MAPVASTRLEQQARDEVELDGQPHAAVEHEARQEAGTREEVVDLVDIAIGEHVFPRNENLVEYDDRVVLIEPAGQRIIEGAAHRRGGHLVRRTAEQLHARRVGGHDADECEILGLDRQRAVVGDEVVMRERGSGGDHFRAADDQAAVGFLLDVHVDVAHFCQFLVAVHRRIHDRVIDEGDFLLHLLVPAPRVFLERLVEVGVGAERGEEGGLVIRAAAHPAVGHARPLGDGIARAHHLFGVARGLEEFVRVAAAAGVGLGSTACLALIVQSIVQAGQHPDGVAEGRMGGDVLDPFAVDPDLAPVAQALDVFLRGERLRSCRSVQNGRLSIFFAGHRNPPWIRVLLPHRATDRMALIIPGIHSNASAGAAEKYCDWRTSSCNQDHALM